jgi:hypothetical protein
MQSNAWMKNPWIWFLVYIPVQMVLAVASIATHNFSLMFQGIGLGMGIFVLAVVMSLIGLMRKVGGNTAQIVMMTAQNSRRFTGHTNGGSAGPGGDHKMHGEQ